MNFSTAKPVVINGSYSCTDSDPATWSQDQQSGGKGFCTVYVVPAVKTSGAAAKKPAPVKKTAPAKPKVPAKPAAKGQQQYGGVQYIVPRTGLAITVR